MEKLDVARLAAQIALEYYPATTEHVEAMYNTYEECGETPPPAGMYMDMCRIAIEYVSEHGPDVGWEATVDYAYDVYCTQTRD